VQDMELIRPPFRRGSLEDIGTLSEFVEIASEGLAMHLWLKIAGPGGDPWSIGRDRVRTGAVGLSYENAVIAQMDGRPAAGVISYAVDNKMAASEALPEVLVPLQELMNEAHDTWYVQVARRRMVKEEWQHPGVAWLLLTKKL